MILAELTQIYRLLTKLSMFPLPAKCSWAIKKGTGTGTGTGMPVMLMTFWPTHDSKNREDGDSDPFYPEADGLVHGLLLLPAPVQGGILHGHLQAHPLTLLHHQLHNIRPSRAAFTVKSSWKHQFFLTFKYMTDFITLECLYIGNLLYSLNFLQFYFIQFRQGIFVFRVALICWLILFHCKIVNPAASKFM